ncbi:hypothetical protein AAE478_006111 [Parahypoxylon ruwenzoriense]
MGAVQSSAKTLWLAIKALRQLNTEVRALLRRASQPPGIPVPNPTKSYWLDDPPFPELVNIRSPTLPNAADIVIIGSGITGAAVARSVLCESAYSNKADPDPNAGLPRVVALEARTLCSGATGRNGGHMKSSPHDIFALFRQTLGPDRAAALTRFQLAHVRLLTELCRAEGWDVAECREVETVDFYLAEEDRDRAFQEIRELEKWVPEMDIRLWDEVEARKNFEVNDYVKGAISYTAGALWPFRFVSCVWKDLLARFGKNLSIETSTSVLSIRTPKQQDYAYEVVTNRGIIKCNHIVHATNGFATQFFPGLRGKMTGVLDTMSAQRPGRQFPDLDGSRSWSVIYGSAFDYVTQRPTVDGQPGDIMLGGGFARSHDGGKSMIGVWDDSRIDALPVAHISGIFPTLFEPHWGEDAQGGRTKKAWSGILGVTGDMRPFVGRLDRKLTGRKPEAKTAAKVGRGVVEPGEWISAGYCGDGMVWAWLSGTAIGIMLAGTENENAPPAPGRPGGALASWFPCDLEPTPRRVKNAGLENLADRFF